MATSDEARACVPKPLVDLSYGNTLERMKGPDIASSSAIMDKLTSTPSEVTTRADELHGGKQDTFQSELYVTDTDVEDIYLTETELESSSYAEQIAVTVNHAGPQSDIDVRGVSQWDHALTEIKAAMTFLLPNRPPPLQLLRVHRPSSIRHYLPVHPVQGLSLPHLLHLLSAGNARLTTV